jgi:hypothetical protein
MEIAAAAVAAGLLAALVVLATSRLLHRTHLLTVQ